MTKSNLMTGADAIVHMQRVYRADRMFGPRREIEMWVRDDMPMTSVVPANAVYGGMTTGQNAGFDWRFYNVGFARADHADVARAFGEKSWAVKNPRQSHHVLRKAVAHPGPTLVDVISQPLHEAAAPVSEWVA